MLVLDDSAVAEARLLHPDRESYFTVAQRHAPTAKGKTWSERGYSVSSLEQVLGAVRDIPDLYVSQASFISKRRGNATAKSIACSFVDLDCYKLGIVPDDATVHAILKQASACGLPEPSYVMSSGRGLYAKWLFDAPLSGVLIPHWKHLQDVLGHVFLAFGSDANARDLARVLRASSTLNSKNSEQVRVIYQSGVVHRFVDLAAVAAQIDVGEFLQSSKQAARQIRVKQDALVTLPSDLGALVDYSMTREPILMKMFSRQSLNWTRFTDLRDLMMRRNGAARGSRDVFLFWMVATLASSGVIDGENFWPEVQNLLRGFPVSRDFDPMTDGSLETLRSRVESHARGEKVEFKGAKYSPIYTPSNDYLIDVLNITDDEQKQLQTIISSTEKQRRSDLKVPGRAERRVERLESRVMAVQLKDAGLSMTAIAEKIGVNKSTVSRWLAPAEVNKTRLHQAYLSQKWEAARIAEWLERRKRTLGERQHQLELMRAQQQHLDDARTAQVRLKTSVHLISLWERIVDRGAAEVDQQQHRQVASHPLEPAPAVHDWDDSPEEDDADERAVERPRG